MGPYCHQYSWADRWKRTTVPETDPCGYNSFMYHIGDMELRNRKKIQRKAKMSEKKPGFFHKRYWDINLGQGKLQMD